MLHFAICQIYILLILHNHSPHLPQNPHPLHHPLHRPLHTSTPFCVEIIVAFLTEKSERNERQSYVTNCILTSSAHPLCVCVWGGNSLIHSFLNIDNHRSVSLICVPQLTVHHLNYTSRLSGVTPVLYLITMTPRVTVMKSGSHR